MDVYRMEDMKGGWFIGDFADAVLRTDKFEVSYKVHPKGEAWDTHYHKVATEVNCLMRGRMTIAGQEFVPGDVFVIHPGEVADPLFLEDCELIVVKVPSVPGDKYTV